MFHWLILSLWIMLPAGVANMAPVLFKWLPFLNYPVDLGKKWKDKEILGPHKTYRGLFVGVICAIVFVFFETMALQAFSADVPIDYTDKNPILLGFLLGFGALFGDMLKSFFKRVRNIQPGAGWPPFDQIDWILGALFFSSFYIKITWQILLISLVLFGALHPLINLAGYYLKIKKNKF